MRCMVALAWCAYVRMYVCYVCTYVTYVRLSARVVCEYTMQWKGFFRICDALLKSP